MALTTRSFGTSTGPGGTSADANPQTSKVLKTLGVPRKAVKAGAGSKGKGGRR